MTYAGLNAIVVGVTNTDNDSGGGVSEVLTGIYVGNGADNRQITGLGFHPDVVIIKSILTQQAVVRTSTMTGDVSKNMATGEIVSNAIQSLDPIRLHRRHHPASQLRPWTVPVGRMENGRPGR